MESKLTEIERKIDANTETLATLLEITSSCCQSFASCNDVFRANPSAPSGEYTITIDGVEVTVYCEMGTPGVCGGEGGWTRIANVDVAAGDDCPSGLFTSVRLAGLKSYTLCDRDQSIDGGACSETTFSTQGISYTKVCGRTRGYQYHGFGYIDGIYDNHRGVDDLNSYYVDGVSITRGDPREHIWTFGDGSFETGTDQYACPCNSGTSSPSTPSYVGDDYYCESGTSVNWSLKLYDSDPLWDGQDCNGNEGPCCANSNLPYFVRDLGASSTEDIDYRICTSEDDRDEAVGVDQIEIYIK